MWVVIVIIPDHCLSIYSASRPNSSVYIITHNSWAEINNLVEQNGGKLLNKVNKFGVIWLAILNSVVLLQQNTFREFTSGFLTDGGSQLG